MYKVCIYNNETETIIHYPVPDKEAPHLNTMNLQEKDNDIDTLSFSIAINNPGYNLLKEFKTKAKVIDTRDNSIRFTGRLLKAPEKMDSNGFYKDVSYESALAYLLDSSTRAETYLTSDIGSALSNILDKHNNTVDDDKKIYLGNVDVTGSIAYTCKYEPTLNAILNMLEGIECHLQVRETDGLLYLDCLQNLSSTIVDVRLGENMKEMVKTYDPTGIATRIIPLGANNLNISSVNGGTDYIEDLMAKGLYGVIEKPIQYSDITDPAELKNRCIEDITNYTQPKLTLEINAIDLSTLTNIKADEFKKGLKLHIINPIMGIDDVLTIVAVDADLTQIYNPKLTVSNIPTTIQDIIASNANNAISNNSVHNGVQVGDSFGIRIVSGDGKFVTTLNATEGISIEDVVRNLKMFFVDIANSTLTMDGIQKITKNGKTIIQNTTNSNGGLFEIYDNDGNLNVKAGSENGTSDNNGGTLILYNDSENNPRVELGIAKNGDFGVANLKNSSGVVKVTAEADDGNGNGIVGVVDSNGIKHRLATEDYVNTEIADLRNYVDQQIANINTGGGTSGS